MLPYAENPEKVGYAMIRTDCVDTEKSCFPDDFSSSSKLYEVGKTLCLQEPSKKRAKVQYQPGGDDFTPPASRAHESSAACEDYDEDARYSSLGL